MTERNAERDESVTSNRKEPSEILKPPAEKADEGTVMDPEINLRDRSARSRMEESDETES